MTRIFRTKYYLNQAMPDDTARPAEADADTEKKPPLPPLPPPPPGVKRTTVLLLYIALMVLGLPVWWRTTAVYRASVPFHLLDKVRPPSCAARCCYPAMP